MAHAPLRLALIGAGDLGEKCAEALGAATVAESWRLIAVADRDGAAAGRIAPPDTPTFTDTRRLVNELKPDAVLLATPPAAAAETVRLAAACGAHVIKAAPLARTLEEAVEMVRAMSAAQRVFAILSPRRFSASYRALIDRRDELGRLFLGRAEQVLNWQTGFGWRGDRQSAGGGALLEAGYDMLDLLVAAMGPPEDIFCVTGRQGRPHMIESDGEVKPLGVYDTDDTAVVVGRGADGAAATAVTSWVTSPTAESLSLHGQSGSAVATPTGCVFRDADGQLVNRVKGDDRPVPAIARQLTALAAALAAAGDAPAKYEYKYKYESSAREHLLTMAVVEAAYLSDRTGHSENALHLLGTHDLTVEDCLADRPLRPAR